MMAFIGTSIHWWMVVVASRPACTLSSQKLATHILSSLRAMRSRMRVQAGLTASAFSFQELHANLGLHFRSNLVRERAVVTTIAATSTTEVTADISRITMEVLATSTTRTITIKSSPVTTKFSLNHSRFHFSHRFGNTCVWIKLTTREILRRKTSIINALAFTFESKVWFDRKKSRRTGRAGSTRLNRNVEKGTENASTTILKTFEIAASFSSFHMEERTLNTTTTMTTNVIATKSTTTKRSNDT